MNITQSKAKNLMAKITIDIIADDYNERVSNVLNDYRKTAVISGFRKGKTPIGIINKKFRNSVVVEEVNKLIQDKLYNHIKEKKVKVLGSPMPINKNEIDWQNQVDFSFEYEIAFAPEFDVKITSKDKLDFHVIKVDAKMIDMHCADIAKRYGKMSNSSVSKEGDLVFCLINQIDLEGNIIKDGIQNEATVSIDHISDKKIKKKFIGIKLGSIINCNVLKAFTNHSDLAAMLGISQKIIHNLKSESFQFTVKNINRLEPASLDSELFEKVYGVNSINDLKDFRNRVKHDLETQFLIESDRMLKNDVVNYFIDNLKLKMPDDFLKRWLIHTSEQPITMETLEKEYDMYSKGLQWQLIENKILENYKIKVSNEDIISHTKEIISLQMRQYGQKEGDDSQLTDIATNVLKNDEEKKKVYDKIYDERTLAVYKEGFNLNQKNISYNDFVKLASEKK
tara:strand:- start:853 stop:2208 length:1356 start_codon:yes stop_codon:yes gene_type:complete